MPLQLGVALSALLFVGCGDPPPTAAVPADAGVPADAAPPDAGPTAVVFAFPTLGDEDALAGLGALPAWEAVIRRPEFLQRRGAIGSIYGVWKAPHLVDETVGDGALSAEIRLPAGTEIPDGARALIWGAWTSPGKGRWVWQAVQVATLPKAGREFAVAPGLVPRKRSPGSLTPLNEIAEQTFRKKTDAPRVSFYLRKRPMKQGDGWVISDSARGKDLARLVLPGEAGSYGGQDYRTDAERWNLKRGVLYWATIHKARGGVLRTNSPPYIVP